VTTISLLGLRAPSPGTGALQLEGPGTLIRATGRESASTDGAIDAPWAAWTRMVLARDG
jgi:hypothetical protein